jgi:hypothetical protein
MNPDSGDDAIIEEVEDVVELDPSSLSQAEVYSHSQTEVPTEDEDQELDPDQEAIGD